MPNVLWLRPGVPDNVSPGRQRIADELGVRGYTVDVRPASLKTARSAGDYDAIIGTSHSGAILGAIAARRHRLPFVLDHVDSIRQLHETNPPWQAWPAQLAESWAMRQADATLFVTRRDMDRLERHADPYKQTHLGVPYPWFIPPTEHAAPKDWPGNPAAIYTGSLTEHYNIRAMCAGAARAGVELVVLGTGPLAEYVQGHPAATYPGSVPHEQVPRWLWHADVGLCLVDDPHTVKVLEYAAAGLPVVQLAGRASETYRDVATLTTADPDNIEWAIHKAIERGPNDDLRELARERDYSRVADDYEWALERALTT